MAPKPDLESIEGVEVHSLVQQADGTLIGAVRFQRELPATDAKLRQRDWTIARSTAEAPEIADALALDPVPADVVLVERDTDDQLLDSLR